jgi:CRISPR-associated protein Cst1
VGERDIGGVGMNDSIKLYPSNWLYNASVIGFLKVVDSNDKNMIENWLNDDGTVTIERNIFDLTKEIEIPKCLKKLIDYSADDRDIDDWLNKVDNEEKTNKEKYKEIYGKLGDFGYKFIRVGNKLFSSKTPYQNLVQLSEWRSFNESGFISFIKNFLKYGEKPSNLICSICATRTAKIPRDNIKLEKRLLNFQEPHIRILAPSIGEFPNAFWNLKTSLLICPLCAYLIIHHHIPFESAKTQSGQIFINAPSFKVMWYLNKFAEQMLSKNKSYQIREILGMSFIEFAQRVAVTLGTWSMMNIEMVIKKYNPEKKKEEIEYYSLPIEITRVLLQRDIASLITATKEPVVLETILNGDFSHLLTLSHKIMRYSFTKSEDKNLSQLRNKDDISLRKLLEILPILYTKINSTINSEVIL